MALKIHYLGLVRAAAGCDDEEVPLPPGGTVKDLLETLAQRYGQKFFRSLVNSRGELHNGVRILLGQTDLPANQALNTSLNESSEVTFLVLARPMAGG
ncbi:MAG TPA: MoaD/ThiS family protein [bacterium]|nr:MoaD/ThiS family protein [bacterium]